VQRKPDLSATGSAMVEMNQETLPRAAVNDLRNDGQKHNNLSFHLNLDDRIDIYFIV